MGNVEETERGWRRVRRLGRLDSLVPVLTLTLALGACASGTGGISSTPPPSGSASTTVPSGTATTGSASTSATATPFGLGTPGAVLGTTDACAAQSAPPTAAPPSTIPVYANAQLTIGSVNGKSGVFGLCSADSVSTIDTYYAAQLPAKGWQHVTNDPLDTARQLTAQQATTSLIVTILPDTGQNGKTNILIIYSGT